MKILLTFLFLHSTCAFMITEAEPGLVLVSPGSTVTLLCVVDGFYEWCKFYHPGGEFCDFEWKRSESNITRQECRLSDSVSFHGKYDDLECGITFTATEGDTGIWKCEIEEYITFRSRGAGRVATAQMNVTVHGPTTPPTPPTPPTLGTTLTTVESVGSTEETKAVTQTTSTTTTALSSQSSEKSDTPEAVTQVDENKKAEAGGSSSVLIGVFLVIIVTVVAVSGAIFYRKRKNSSTATAVYDRESKTSHDQTNMIRNSNSNITFHSNSNLHEYYPPNLTYSTVTPESQA